MATLARASSLHRRLLLIAAVGIVPVALAAGVVIYGFYQAQRAQAERTALEVTRALSTALDAELRRTIAALEVVASLADTGDPESLREPLEHAVATRGGWRSLLLFDLEGHQLINTRIPAGDPLPRTVQKDTLDEVARTGKPLVGQLTRGPVVGWAVPVRVPVMHDGRVRYVLTAAVSPDSLLDVMLRQRLQAGWVVTAVDRAGARVLRWPSQAEYIGTPVSGTLAQMMAGGKPEATGLTTTSEGNDVYTAFSRSPESGWAVALGIPRAEVEAVAWSSLGTFTGGVLAALVIGLLAAVITGRVIVATLAREQAARAEAEGLSRAKDEFLAMLGHELRNPLGAATNAAHLLQAPHLAEPARRRAGDILLRQLHNLARITDDLLDVGRALTGKIALRPQPLDLAAAAHQAIATLRATGRLDRHQVHEALEPAWADVDPVRFDQVLTNLLINAVKYTPEGGNIHVTTGRESGWSVLGVADDGIGMSPELAARAFELFVQGDRAIDRAQGGLGIGLTLVRRLAELHGGSADVASAGAGQGSEFTVRFPAIKAPVADARPSRVQHAS